MDWIDELKYVESQKAAQIRLLQRNRGSLLLREVLDFLEHASISYSNGVTHNGFDEGDVRGGEMHNALVAKIKKTLGHPAIVYGIEE